MGPPSTMPYAVGLRCDASSGTGVGHVVRCLALSDEVRARGGRTVLLGSVTVSWLRSVLDTRGVEVVAAPDAPDTLAAQAGAAALDTVVLDGYALDPGCGATLRATGMRVLALVDGPFGAAQDADVYLDQNLGATPPLGPSAGATQLAGLDFTLFRDEVLDRRPHALERPPPSGPPRLLAVFGGTDSRDAAATLVPLVLATGVPVEVVAIAPSADVARELTRLPTGSGQSMQVREAVADLPALAVTCDAAVSASGSSIWELLCLGVPTAAVAVVDNQEVGYLAALDEGLVLAGGRLERLRSEDRARSEVVATLTRLLIDGDLRARLRHHGMQRLDGLGRRRVLDALGG